jgi:maleate isomerase
MHGWRARIGILVVASDVTCESELYRIVPEGVSIHTSRMTFPGAVTPEALEKLADEALRGTELLIPACIDTVTFCCTSGSFIKGAGYDRQIINTIKSRFPEVTATTTSTAVSAALEKLNVRKAAVATPYIHSVNEALKDYLEAEGISIVNIEGLGILEDQETNNLSPEATYRLASRVDVPEAEAIFISCTSLRSIEVIQTLETDLGKPVFSSNTATIWDALRKSGVCEPIMGYGKLLTLPQDPTS